MNVKDAKQNPTMNIDADELIEDENFTITVKLPKDAKGNVAAVVDGKTYTTPVVNGIANIPVHGLKHGKYTVLVSYSGDDKYNPISKEINYTVEEIDKSYIISAPDVTKYYKGPERFVVNITDYAGNPVSNRSVTIVINGQKYDKITKNDGTTSIALGLNSGVYNVTVTVGSETSNSVVTILSTVHGTDVVKGYRNATPYYATFRDSEGNYLKEGTTVTFNINGVMYERKISGGEGLAKLNLNLEQGIYVITATNPKTGEMASNNITIISRLVENNDVTKYYEVNCVNGKLTLVDAKDNGKGSSKTTETAPATATKDTKNSKKTIIVGGKSLEKTSAENDNQILGVSRLARMSKTFDATHVNLRFFIILTAAVTAIYLSKAKINE